MTKLRIAIIGGGAAATLLLAHLMSRPGGADAEYHLYDRTERFARGVAYSTTQMAHLLNVRAGNMSALAHDPDDFARWVGGTYKAADFVPRKIYGDYLETKLAVAQHVLSVTLHTDDVLSCSKEDNAYRLTSAAGTAQYDRVVLATGNCQPLSPAIEGEIGGYHAQPWNLDYAALRHLDHVALIGCGLSAVDAVLSLHAHDYKGHITIISRRTLLPRVHVDPVAYPAFFNAQQLPDTARDAFKAVHTHIAQAAAQHVPWQAVIDAMRPATNAIWQVWNQKERARFMRHLLTLWNVHRHRMAPQIADVLSSCQQQGRLGFHKARVIRVCDGPRIITTDGEIDTQAAINCLGYRYQEPGRVFEVSDRIGPALFGPLFETTAIPEIRMQAAALVAKLFP